MQKTDYYLSAAIYVLGFAYIGMVSQMSKAAATYPLFVGVLLMVLNTVFLIKVYISRRKNKPEEEKLFNDFKAKQFFTVFITCISYIFTMGILGFYTSTIVYLIVTLGLLGVKKKWILVSTVVFCGVIYMAFSVLLRVPLPTGYLI